MPATGGADPQKLSDARVNAPLTVLTLERVVSLADYENFARAFAGVGKAQAIAVWSGETHIVYLTVAASDGSSVKKGSSLYTTLVGAINNLKDPVQIFQVAGYQSLAFSLKAALLIDKVNFVSDTVQAAVVATLTAAFSFNARAFAQAVTEAEIVALIQSVPGILASNLSQLYRTGDPAGPMQKEPPPFLAASPARWENGAIQPAQLLLLKSAGITLTEMMP
jgi:predicted phage baseplate assembly protein